MWKATGNLFIPSKTATLVPEFAVENLPMGRTAALVPEFAVKEPWIEQSDLITPQDSQNCESICVNKENLERQETNK